MRPASNAEIPTRLRIATALKDHYVYVDRDAARRLDRLAKWVRAMQRRSRYVEAVAMARIHRVARLIRRRQVGA